MTSIESINEYPSLMSITPRNWYANALSVLGLLEGQIASQSGFTGPRSYRPRVGVGVGLRFVGVGVGPAPDDGGATGWPGGAVGDGVCPGDGVRLFVWTAVGVGVGGESGSTPPAGWKFDTAAL